MVSKINVKSKAKDNSDNKSKQGGGETENKRFKKLSNYGKQLAEKQKLKFSYGMREKQFKRFYALAASMDGSKGENLISLLERRLDNVIFRLKLAVTRDQARQMIVHGHILVNKKKVTSPSFLVKVDDFISLKEISKEKKEFIKAVVEKRLNIAIRVPDWLELNKKDMDGKVLRFPVKADIKTPVEEHLIVELYSK